MPINYQGCATIKIMGYKNRLIELFKLIDNCKGDGDGFIYCS